MTRKKVLQSEAAELRRRAEEELKANAPESGFPRTDDETQRLLHELQVHQIELEMQNAELRRARDEVETALGRFTDLYDFAPVGYFTLDRDEVIRAVNLTGASLLGIERTRLIGRRFGLFIAVEIRPTFTDFLGKVFSSPSKEACEVALRAEGSHPLFVQIEAVATSSAQECHVAIIDISKRRQLEEKVELLNTELAVHATDLEAANIELEAFNYSVSHDLRSPLTVINSYCQVLQEMCGSELSQECRGYIRGIYDGTMQMSQLIDTMLNFAHVTRVELRHDKVNLSIIAEEVALGVKVSAPERRVTFRIAKGIVTNGDAGMWRVVLDNLIGNAWKYSVNREETIIEFGMTEVEGNPACFVRDNGSGFDMAHADKLFLPFQRIPGTEVDGHGIGLATVERIVRRHGGRIWAESEPGKGATFYFTMG